MLENSDRCAKHISLLRPQDALRCACHRQRLGSAASGPSAANTAKGTERPIVVGVVGVVRVVRVVGVVRVVRVVGVVRVVRVVRVAHEQIVNGPGNTKRAAQPENCTAPGVRGKGRLSA